MTFASAIAMLRNGKAAYSPAMKGYVCRRDHAIGADSGLVSKYDIVFVENADIDPYAREEAPEDGTEYAFTREESVSGVVTWYNPNLGVEGNGEGTSEAGESGDAEDTPGNGQVERPFILDCTMFAAMLASDWEVVDTETAEARKTALRQNSRW